METFTSQQAADQLGVTVQKFHRLVAEHHIEPMLSAPGRRGAKFWKPADIRRLAKKVAA